MFMQAGFAFLEAGLTRMKNVGHIAAKNVLIFALASIVYYLVGFGIAFGDGGNGLVGGSGFVPVGRLAARGRHGAVQLVQRDPGRGRLPVRGRVLRASRSRSSGARWPSGRGSGSTSRSAIVFTLIYSLVSHWIWSPDGWLFAKGMQDFAGSTVVHYQGALAGLAGALLLGPRIGKFDRDGKPNAIPGHNMAYTTLGVIILWFGWFGFNPGSTLGVDFGGVGFFAYVALNTNLAAAAGVLGAVITSWLVIKKPDLSMMLNGAIAALVAITAACAFVAPWAAIVIGLVVGRDRRRRRARRRAARHRRSRRRGRRARHVGRLGNAVARLPRRAEPRGRSSATGQGGLFYGGGFHQLGVQALGLVAVGAFTFSASFGVLWVFKRTVGIRTEPEVETAGLDVSEHGMWGYPEFYIPVPGGYGTESHGHLGLAHAHRHPVPAHAMAARGAGGRAHRLTAAAAVRWTRDVSRRFARTRPLAGPGPKRLALAAIPGKSDTRRLEVVASSAQSGGFDHSEGSALLCCAALGGRARALRARGRPAGAVDPLPPPPNYAAKPAAKKHRAESAKHGRARARGRRVAIRPSQRVGNAVPSAAPEPPVGATSAFLVAALAAMLAAVISVLRRWVRVAPPLRFGTPGGMTPRLRQFAGDRGSTAACRPSKPPRWTFPWNVCRR